MGWTIHYDVTDAQKAERGSILAFYGLLSVVFSFAFLSALSLLKLFCRQGKETPLDSPTTPSKPQNGQFAENARNNVIRWNWWLEWPLIKSRPSIGTRTFWLSVIAGIGWMVWLSTASTQEGRITVALFPIQYFLSSKAILQFIAPFTLYSHETLNIVHRWLGRTIVWFLYLHGAFYVYYFIVANRLARMFRLDVIIGFIMISMFITVVFTSFRAFRERAYRRFYTLHITLTSAVLILAWMHVRHTRPYVLISAGIFVTDKALRLSRAVKTTANVTHVTDDILQVSVTIPVKHRARFKRMAPGMHVYLVIPTLSRVRAHPFTLAEALDGNLRIIARKHDGFTRSLASFAGRRSGCDITVWVDGPYGAAVTFPKIEDFDKVLLIAGGVGASFTYPIWQSLNQQRHVSSMREIAEEMDEEEVEEDDAGVETGLTVNTRRRGRRWRKGDTRFIWAVRRLHDTSWVTKSAQSDHVFSETDAAMKMEIFVTGAHNQGADGIELQQQHQSDDYDDANAQVTSSLARQGIEALIDLGRPDITRIVQSAVNSASTSGDRLAILTCGPPSMSHMVKTAVNNSIKADVDMGKRVWLWRETFGW